MGAPLTSFIFLFTALPHSLPCIVHWMLLPFDSPALSLAHILAKPSILTIEGNIRYEGGLPKLSTSTSRPTYIGLDNRWPSGLHLQMPRSKGPHRREAQGHMQRDACREAHAQTTKRTLRGGGTHSETHRTADVHAERYGYKHREMCLSMCT